MPKRTKRQFRRNFLRDWRKHRKLSVEKLAELSGMSPGNVSLFENRKQGYSNDGLEAWAEVLHCKPGDILDYPPEVVEAIKEIRERLAKIAAT